MKQIECDFDSAGCKLEISVFMPDDEVYPDDRPLLLQFYGSGWNLGRRSAHYPVAEAFAKAGYVVALPNYRTFARYGTTPLESVEDAQNAYDFVLRNKGKWKCSAENVVLGGGSAGAQLAFMAAKRSGIQPKCFIFQNPAFDDQVLKKMCGMTVDYRTISPIEQLDSHIAPMIIFHAEDDGIVPISCVEKFRDNAEKYNLTCEFHRYPVGGHGFYMPNNRRQTITYYDVMSKAIAFADQYISQKET